MAPWRNILAKSKQKPAGLSLSHTTDGYKFKKIQGVGGMVAHWSNTLAKSKQKLHTVHKPYIAESQTAGVLVENI